jgi:hypothetical protein
MGCTSLEAWYRGANMEKSLTRQTFGVPSQGVLEDKFARLSEAENAYKTKRRELEQQFKFKAAALRAFYLAAVLEIHEVATVCYRQ